MAVIFSIPILLVLLVLQSTVASKVTLLNGTADLLLVWLAAWALSSKDRSGYILAGIAGALVSYITAIPWYIYLSAYLLVILLARYFSQKLWESPLLAMLIIIMIASIYLYTFTFIGLRIKGVDYPLSISLNQVIIPSVFLNLFIAIPVFAIVKDFSKWFYRSENAS